MYYLGNGRRRRSFVISVDNKKIVRIHLRPNGNGTGKISTTVVNIIANVSPETEEYWPAQFF